MALCRLRNIIKLEYITDIKLQGKEEWNLVMAENTHFITVAEYAKKHGVTPRTIRQKAQMGTLNAIKIGRDWLIDEEEPYLDKRVKSGKYTNWRKSSKKEQSEEI